MNTSRDLIEQRRQRRSDQLQLAVINKQLRNLETPTKDEGFDKLIVHKDFEQPRYTKVNEFQIFPVSFTKFN